MVFMIHEQQRRERFTAYSHMLKERFDNGILAELQPLNQWVVWRSELEDGKKKKIPYNPQLHRIRASVKVPKSWGTLDQALKALETGDYSGIGFMLTPPLVMIDLDNSFDRKTGTITDPKAEKIVRDVNSYFEASPYKGLHGLAYTDRPIRNFHTGIEIYGQDRFTTITTDHIAGTLTTIENRTEAIQALYRQFAPPVELRAYQNTSGGLGSGNALSELPPEAANDPALQRLLRGDISGFASPSNADFVLVMKLLHWTGDNAALTRKLFLQSGLYREDKTERKTGATTYIDMTIHNALKKRRNPPQRR
jgi:putative DNA primase/helicase